MSEPFTPLLDTIAARSDLSIYDKVIYAYLCRRINGGGYAYPSIMNIQAAFDFARMTVFRSLTKLENVGMVRREIRAGQSTKYWPSDPYLPDTSTSKILVPERYGGSTSEVRDPYLSDTHKRLSKRLIKKPEATPQKLQGLETQFPAELDTPEFRAAWSDFEQHRREIKKKLTPLAARKQLMALAKLGTSRAISAIAHSVANGWTGIFEEKTNGHTQFQISGSQHADRSGGSIAPTNGAASRWRGPPQPNKPIPRL